jgi:hypothetical protein
MTTTLGRGLAAVPTRHFNPEQRLTETLLQIANRYATQPQILGCTQALDEQLAHAVTPLDRSVLAALIGCSYSSPFVDRDLMDVYECAQAASRHEGNRDHLFCCSDNCDCADGRVRCERCDDQPQERLDEALHGLLRGLYMLGARTHLTGAAQAAA